MKKTLILVVDDERPLANALHLKLQHVGLNAIVAYNGEEALELVKNNDISLILLDIVMPGMDGFAVLEKLKKESSKAKVVVLSNLSQEEDVRRVKELGAVEYFVKSNTPLRDIVEYIMKLLPHEQTQ